MTSKDAIIAELRALVKKQAEQIAALTKEVEDLKLQLAKARKDSSTSSKSPSSDITKPKKDKPKGKPGSRKKPKIGGQPGRQRKLREPLPPERVNKTIIHELDVDEIDRLAVVPTDQFDSIQTVELPDTPLVITEHRFRRVRSC